MAKFVQLTNAMRDGMKADSALAAAGAYVFGPPSAENPNVANVSANGDTDAWTVPEGALRPTSVTVFGRSSTGVSFDDGVSVAVSDRKALITCSPLPSNDPHCDSSTGKLQYAQGSYINFLEMWALGIRQVEFQKELNFYKISP